MQVLDSLRAADDLKRHRPMRALFDAIVPPVARDAVQRGALVRLLTNVAIRWRWGVAGPATANVCDCDSALKRFGDVGSARFAEITAGDDWVLRLVHAHGAGSYAQVSEVRGQGQVVKVDLHAAARMYACRNSGCKM